MPIVVQCRCDVIVESVGRSHELSNLLLTWKLCHVVVQRWTSISRFLKFHGSTITKNFVLLDRVR